jgi:uncharacterized membrane protein YeaQ/YmgE (transglycosylase-associated protein family)
MDITLETLVVWVILGALAGTLIGRLLRGSKAGYGAWANLGIGLVGAVIGGLVFRAFSIDLGLGAIAITAEDLIAAILGTLAFVLVLKLRKRKAP